MFHRSGFENTRPDGFPVLEVAPGDGAPADGPPQFVPLRRSAITGEILGPVADLTLTQTFSYSSAECSRVLEALYRFPLPGDAAVTGVRVTFGDVTIEALLKERHQAEADYEAARESGRQAALTTRESPDVFTLHLAGLHPDQEVRVETRYVQQARADGAGWSLRIPLTTAPRYVREQESGRHTAGQPLALLRDPGHRFSLDLLFSGAPAVACSTHPLASRTTDAGAHISLQDGEVLPDRDCVLHWMPPRDQHRPSIQGLAHHTAGADPLYFLALVSPPASPNSAAAVPREVILLVDHSGSMSGAKWDAADWAVKQFLAGLGPHDRFNLCLFHSATRWYAGKMREATPAVVQDAIAFLERHRDSGGTELGTALEQALGQNRMVGDIARHLLIVTDAEVSDAARLCEMADHESAHPDRRRISVLCIDAAPNSYLASELAERGGGVARFLTSSPEEEDITTALDEILADWAQPVLTAMRLEVNRPQVVAAGRAVETGSEPGWSAVDLGDLPAGRPVWVAGRAPASGTPDLTFRLVAGGRRLAQARMPLAMCGERPALRTLFGARRVLALEHIYSQAWSEVSPADVLRRLGYGPKEVFSGAAALAAEQVRGNRSDEVQSGLRALLVREALDYGLICAETAFVAARQEAGKPASRSRRPCWSPMHSRPGGPKPLPAAHPAAERSIAWLPPRPRRRCPRFRHRHARAAWEDWSGGSRGAWPCGTSRPGPPIWSRKPRRRRMARKTCPPSCGRPAGGRPPSRPTRVVGRRPRGRTRLPASPRSRKPFSPESRYSAAAPPCSSTPTGRATPRNCPPPGSFPAWSSGSSALPRWTPAPYCCSSWTTW